MGGQIYSSTKLREWLEQWEPLGYPHALSVGSPGRTTSGAWRTVSGCWSSREGAGWRRPPARGSTSPTPTGLTRGHGLGARLRALRRGPSRSCGGPAGGCGRAVIGACPHGTRPAPAASRRSPPGPPPRSNPEAARALAHAAGAREGWGPWWELLDDLGAPGPSARRARAGVAAHCSWPSWATPDIRPEVDCPNCHGEGLVPYPVEEWTESLPRVRRKGRRV